MRTPGRPKRRRIRGGGRGGTKRRLARKTVAVIFGIVDVLFVLFLLLPLPLGGKWIMVLSASMTPALAVGGLVLVTPADPATLQVGDIIVHNPPGNPEIMVAHRAVEKIAGDVPGFRTKGDATEEADPYVVTASEVVGKVRLHLPRVGYMIDRLGELGRTPLGLALLMGVPGALIVAGEVRNILAARDPRRVRQKILKDRLARQQRLFRSSVT